MFGVIGLVILHLLFLVVTVYQSGNIGMSQMVMERGVPVRRRKAAPREVVKLIAVLVVWIAVGFWVHS